MHWARAAGWRPTKGYGWMQPSREFIQSDTSRNSTRCESHRVGNWTVAEGLGIAVATSPEGPFKFVAPKIVDPERTGSDIQCGLTPSALLFVNDTVLLAFRYDVRGGDMGGERLAIASAPGWRGPYTVARKLPPAAWCDGRGSVLIFRRTGRFAYASACV